VFSCAYCLLALIHQKKKKRDLPLGAGLVERLQAQCSKQQARILLNMASQQGTAKATKSPYAVFLYYPNLIGYARIGFVLASYYIANQNWQLSTLFYVLAFAGDVVDGAVARKFNQCECNIFSLPLKSTQARSGSHVIVLPMCIRVCVYHLRNSFIIWRYTGYGD
jgi:CDP-alcohol phosphatidyltransferase